MVWYGKQMSDDYISLLYGNGNKVINTKFDLFFINFMQQFVSSSFECKKETLQILFIFTSIVDI